MRRTQRSRHAAARAAAWRAGAVATLGATCALLYGVPAQAGTTKIALTAPHRVRIEKTLRVLVTAPGGSPVYLERRTEKGWRRVAHGIARRGSGARLSWRVRSPLAYLTLRASARSGGHLSHSHTRLVRIARERRILEPGAILSAPAPGHGGDLHYGEHLALHKGSVVVSGIGPQTPDGFLGLVTSISYKGGGTTIETQPTTLLAAIPQGSIEVNTTQLGAVSSSAGPPQPGSPHERRIWRRVSKVAKCQNGASITIGGSISLSPTVAFKAHWSLFGGLSSSFQAGMTMDGDLSASAQAAASCKVGPLTLAQWALPPIDVQVGPVPVILVPEIRVVMSGDGSVGAQVLTGVHSSLTATGGIAYEHGKFHPLGKVSHSFSVTPPTLSGRANLSAELGPTLGLYLYGVAGPEVDLRAGASLKANTSQNPWWTLSAPVDLGARLSIPDLGIESGELTIYHKSFPLAQANGPFGGGGGGGSPAPPGPAPGTTLVDNHASTEGSGSIDHEFSKWAAATGLPVEVKDSLPASLKGYRCVVLDLNEEFAGSEPTALGNYLHEGGTIVALGEHAGFDAADAAINDLSEALGASLFLNDDEWDVGTFFTSNINHSSLTANVGVLGYNWASSISYEAPAEPLVEGAEGEFTLIASQSLQGGTFVLSGDSDAFTDDDYGAYEEADNGTMVRDMCG